MQITVIRTTCDSAWWNAAARWFVLVLVGAALFVPAAAQASAGAGSLDTSFNPAGTPPGTVATAIGTTALAQSVAVQSDGKIVVGGYATIGGKYEFALARYNAGGALDTTFNPGGAPAGVVTTAIGTTALAQSVAVQSDGKIVVGGYAMIGGKYEFALARYDTDGALDTTFNPGGAPAGVVTTAIGTSAQANSVAVQSDGKIVVGGYAYVSSTDEFALARYNAGGALDMTFNAGGAPAGVVTTAIGTSALAQSVAVQSDGKIVVGGYAMIGGNGEFAVVRYNAGGALDATFGPGGAPAGVVTTAIDSGAWGYSVAVQSDGKILVGGYATPTVSGNGEFALARYDTDGALDTTFNPGGAPAGVVTTTIGTSAVARSVAVQSDGKIVAGGYTIVSGTDEFALARYDTDGALDTTFGPGGAPAGVVTTTIGTSAVARSVAVQSDGKIVAGGYATPTAGGNAEFALARYLAVTPPANTTAPSISGTTTDGSVLTADHGKWTGDQPITYAYQWQRCAATCANIAGATSSTYTLQAVDVGDTVRVVVTADNAAPGTVSADSAKSATVTPAPPVNTTVPSISGDAVDGHTLTASSGAWTGDQPITYAYQWQRCAATCANIVGATSSTYTLQAVDVGDTVRVVVTADNAASGTVSADSAKSATVTAAPSTTATPPPATTTSAPSPAPLVTPGDDRYIGTPGDDAIALLAGDDVVYGLGGDDYLVGDAGNDRIWGNLGNDRLYGSGGNDRLYGGAGNDHLDGGHGSDDLFGGNGNDYLYAGRGSDHEILYGGRGNDVLIGKGGDDFIVGGAGHDVVSGGRGNDRIDVRDGHGGDFVRCGKGFDQVEADPGDVISRDCEVRTNRFHPVSWYSHHHRG